MTKFSIAFSAVLLAFATGAVAEEPVQKADSDHQLTKATYLITGLHCPPCTRTVESSLGKVEGIKSIKVDWKTKNARIEFDEAILPAQRVAQLIAATPHMMGGNLHYDGWLALNVEELRDDATGKPIKETLGKIEGVKTVALYPKHHSVGVQFAAKGDVTDRQLIDALTQAGYHAKNL